MDFQIVMWEVKQYIFIFKYLLIFKQDSFY